MIRSSLWKLETIPEKSRLAIPYPLGTLDEVRRKILDVRHTKELHSLMSDSGFYSRFMWDSSVLLVVMDTNDKPKQVNSIVLINASDVKEFYLLYLQLYELFGVTLLDEEKDEFIPIRTYKKLYL